MSNETTDATALPHSASLDGIRFVAITLVFLHHALQFAPSGSLPFIRYGYLGVPIFFVLSGYLIGNILLHQRDAGTPLGSTLRTFYARRVLRIFPVYYALVVFHALRHARSDGLAALLSGDTPWHLAYLTNVRVFLVGLEAVPLRHFWSLSVEEHFYLVAPLAVLLLDRRALVRGIGAFVVVGLVARFTVSATGAAREWMVLSPLRFDLLGLGIAAAILRREGSVFGVSRVHLRRVGAVATCLFAAWMLDEYLPIDPVRPFLAAASEGALGVATAAGILLLANAPTSLAARVLAAEPFAYLGRISYGLYLFHPDVLGVCSRWFGRYSFTNAAVSFALTVLIAAASFHGFEARVLRLKRHVGYAAG